MSRIIPIVDGPMADENLEGALDRGKIIRLDSLVDSPYEAKVSSLVSDRGKLLGTLLYVWNVAPSYLSKE